MATNRSVLALVFSCVLIGPAAAQADMKALAAKMNECAKVPAGTPQAKACLAETEALRAKMMQKVAADQKAAQAAHAAQAAQKMTVGQAMAKMQPQERKQFEAAVAEAAKKPEAVSAVPAKAQPQASSVASVGAVRPVSAADLKGMDLETAMMAVQTNRANMLESQLKGQLDVVQKKNDQIARMNQLLTEIRSARPSGTDPEKRAKFGKDPVDTLKRLKEAGVAAPAEVTAPAYEARQRTFDLTAEQLKGSIDALSNSQQMDMLRLQSLSNKRNEAFDTMTNFIKKMQDNRSSIIGNMR